MAWPGEWHFARGPSALEAHGQRIRTGALVCGWAALEMEIHSVSPGKKKGVRGAQKQGTQAATSVVLLRFKIFQQFMVMLLFLCLMATSYEPRMN